jgi:hypothetical protein
MKPPIQLSYTKRPFFKNGEQEGKTGLVWVLLPVVGGWKYKEEAKEVNMVAILCAHVWKQENETC